MNPRLAFCGVAACVSLLALAPARAAAPALTKAEVVTRFQAATGSRLVVDKGSSRPGRYTALRLPPSVTNLARYGDFTIWVVGPSSLDEDVAQLLADGHTGVVGPPGAAGIHWERSTALDGAPRWLGKKRYGANVVLWRVSAAAKVDPSFRRLHDVLRRKVVR